MFQQIRRHYRTIWILALQVVRERYTGTMGGALWSIVHPLLLLLIFWVVFDQGFKMGATAGRPFILVLFCGLIPWMAFNEGLLGAATAITGRAYLVKKIAFPTEILPLTHLVAALLTHAVMVVVLFGMFAWYGKWPRTGLILFPYYLFAMCCFATGLSLLLAAVNVFHRDVSQGLAIVMNIWFWATPIVWPLDLLPPRFAPLLDYNPMNYVISGYRSSFLEPSLVLPGAGLTLYFWALTAGLWMLGGTVFRRLKPNFADVL